MPLTVSPTLAASLGNTASGLPLQPGTVVAARVQQVLEAGLTRILIAGMSLDVASNVALKPGTHLQLAVSQTPDAIELAVLGQGRSAAAALASAQANPSANERAALLRAPLSASPSVQTSVTAQVATPPIVPSRMVSPEAIVKAVLAQTAEAEAPRQASLAPLFANVAVASSLKSLSPDVAQKAAQLLALRPELGGQLTADDIQQAFKSSGLFLEQNLKTAAASPSANAAPPPDLKAALLVFRQVLTIWSEALPEKSSSAAASATASAAAPPRGQSVVNAGATALLQQDSVQPGMVAPSIVTPQGLSEAVESAGNRLTGVPIVSPHEGVGKQPLLAVPGAGLARALADLTALADADLPALLRTMRAAAQKYDVPLQPLTSPELPQPPFRGAAPSAQPVAQPTLTPATPQADVAATLLRDTDAALSRQTMHQIASLPDRVDVTLPRNEANAPRWSFEIPFATPQGTAVAQFEISSDGGGNAETASQKDRVWRVRFSLDVEPAGAVHASIAMVGQSGDASPRTSVRLWAERPETALRLQSASDDLSQALRRAELEPGSIVIGDGSPPVRGSRSGRFLDRAS